MTLLDKALEFANGQAVTASADATNDIDLGPLAAGNTHRDLGAGEQLYLNVYVTEAATAAGAATVNFVLKTDDAAGFGSAVTLYDSGAIGKATLALGYAFQVPIPRGCEKFLRLSYVVATGPLTAGKFRAYITDSFQDTRTYVSGTPIVG